MRGTRMARSTKSSGRQRGSAGDALKRLMDAQSKAQLARARAEQADANVQMVRAKITASGRQVVWDPKTGAEKVISR